MKAQVEPDQEDDPAQEPGFGGRGYSGSGVIVIGIFATIFVVAMAALTTWIMSLLSNVEASNPVSETIHGSTGIPDTPPVRLQPSSAVTVPDNKDYAALIDGKTATTWSTEEEDTGVLVTLDTPTHLAVLPVVQSNSTGAKYAVYGVNQDSFNPENPQAGSLHQLARGKFKNGKEDIELEETTEQFDGLLLMITELPKSDKATIADIGLVGQP